MARSRLLAVALVLASGAAGCRGDEPPTEVPKELRKAPPLIPSERGVIRVAGSGGMTPLVRALGLAFRAAFPAAPRVTVEDSIGSGGGIRAALDGAVDIGLATRRLTAQEASLPLVVVPIGRDAVVLAAHPDVTADSVSSEELVAIFSGRQHAFADGSPVTPLLRDRGESANLALDVGVPGMAEAREIALRLGFRVLYHDDAMAAALAVTPGAVGVYALGLLRETRIPLKVLKLDGRAASINTLADGSWPLVRPMALVLRADRIEQARTFLRFVVSPEGSRVVEQSGCRPEPTLGAGSREPIPAADYRQVLTR